MKNTFLLVLCFSLYKSAAQLHLLPSNYLYVNDRTVFVNNAIELQDGTGIYLRNEAQLLQGDHPASDNNGNGKVSVFQEGSTNNFQFNYWCSPVGNASSFKGNENFGITMLHSPIDSLQSTPVAVTSGYDGTASPLTIAEYWIFKFLQSSAYSGWEQVGSQNMLLPGEGFTMKGTAGADATMVLGVENNPGSRQRYDFRGKPNDGDVHRAVARLRKPSQEILMLRQSIFRFSSQKQPIVPELHISGSRIKASIRTRWQITVAVMADMLRYQDMVWEFIFRQFFTIMILSGSRLA
ncbi:hypothetical protein [Flavobacterium sp. 3HN19-14]|uniref:hypothetical protein n=1 Tax=Flavobacterium sp. 3HN19-14 TaxID=3448133 RepID=UPI003EE31A35